MVGCCSVLCLKVGGESTTCGSRLSGRRPLNCSCFLCGTRTVWIFSIVHGPWSVCVDWIPVSKGGACQPPLPPPPSPSPSRSRRYRLSLAPRCRRKFSKHASFAPQCVDGARTTPCLEPSSGWRRCVNFAAALSPLPTRSTPALSVTARASQEVVR